MASFSLDCNTNDVRVVAFAPDGAALTSAGAHVMRWDWWKDSSKPARTFPAFHQGYVLALATARNGGPHAAKSILISGSADKNADSKNANNLAVWDLDTGDKVWELRGHTAAVNAVAATDRGLAFSASDDKTVAMWDLQTGERLDQTEPTPGPMYALALAPGDRLVAAGDEGILYVWQWSAKKLKLETTIPKDSPSPGPNLLYSLAAAQGDRMVSGGADRSLRIWDLKGTQYPAGFAQPANDVRAVAVTPDGQRLAVAARSPQLCFFRLSDQKELPGLPMVKGVFNFVVTWEGRGKQWALTGGSDGWARVWDITPPPHPEGVTK